MSAASYPRRPRTRRTTPRISAQPARPEVEKEGREHRPEGPDEGRGREEAEGEPQLGPENAAKRQRARHEGAGGSALQAEVGGFRRHHRHGRQDAEGPEVRGPQTASEEKCGEKLESAAGELREELDRAAARRFPSLCVPRSPRS